MKDSNPHLMFLTQVCLQFAELSAVEEAQSTLVGFDVIMFHHVQMQVLSIATRKSAVVTAEDDTLKITGQLWATHFNRYQTFLCERKTQGR